MAGVLLATVAGNCAPAVPCPAGEAVVGVHGYECLSILADVLEDDSNLVDPAFYGLEG